MCRRQHCPPSADPTFAVGTGLHYRLGLLRLAVFEDAAKSAGAPLDVPWGS